jgi:uncharacterized protein
LTPFQLSEVGSNNGQALWRRGGLPLSFLASSDSESALWRQEYVRTFLERDIPALGIQIPPVSLRRFWMMLAHVHGQIFTAADIAKSLGVSDHTVRRYLDILAGTFMIRVLSPWWENIGKRQVKSPKIFFRDSGLFHTLLDIQTQDHLLHHPKMGASWEGFALEEVIRHHAAQSEETYFWATHNQAELDLLILQGGRRLGYEIKYTERPKVTPSMRIALKDLKLDHLCVIYPGERRFPLGEGIEALNLAHLIMPSASDQG